MSLLRACFVLCWVLLASPLAALTPPPPPPPPTPPTVWVASGLQPIRLAEVDITIRATGMVAETVLDLRFENPNGRVLEGELVFPLLPGQTVSGYALEVDGVLREGVVVPKQTARVAFETITRQGIDPGLAELIAGNVFRTRLYPIPAQGTKRVQLKVVSALEDAGTHWRYQLPLQFAAPVGRFRVRAEAVAERTPVVEAVQQGDPALVFDAAGPRWVAELARKDVQPRRPLAFLIPKSDGATSVVAAVDERAPAWRSVVAQVETGRPDGQGRLTPKRVAVYYDASRRALDRDRTREQAVLAELVKQLGRVEVTLIPFRDVAEAPRRLQLKDGDAGPLLAELEALPLDGGVSYGAIDLTAAGSADLVLLIGDGLSSFGPAEPVLAGANGRQLPVRVLMAASSGDPARLTRIARASGGGLIDLSRSSPDQAVNQLLTPTWRLLSAKSESGDCVDLSPAAPVAVGASLTIHARCRGAGPLTLAFGDGTDREVLRRIDYAAKEPVEPMLAPAVHQLWAQARIAELEADATPDEARITELGVRYGVVTRSTSLLVLDRIEDYVRYRVEPKEADLRERYRALLAQQPKAAPDPGERERLDALYTRWQAFRAKHEADYPGIEAVLVPLAEAERAAWAGDPGEREAEAALKQAQALSARWTREGGEAKSRASWEREAARLVYALESLRERRPVRVASARPDAVGAAAGEADARLDEMAVLATRRSAEAPAERARPAPMAESASAPAMAIAQSAPAPVAAAPAPSSAVTGTGAEPAPPRARVELAGWQPDAPYLATLREAKDAYAEYLRLREQYGTQPSYYLDVADLLREAKQPALAQRVLSNLAALDPGNTALLRVMAYRLMQWGTPSPAAHAFEVALSQRPEEPQSHRDLALALAKLPSPDRARAARLLWTVATGEWDDRFPDIELIALHELNELLARAGAAAAKPAALGIDPRFVQPLPVGLRVVLTWDANDTDIDLWVVDPAGERTYYSAPQSTSGGQMSRDFTGGYGPEVYTIRRPMPGTYRVLVNYFGDRRQSLTGPVTLQLAFQTGFNTVESRETAVTVRLGENRETQEIGSFRVAEPE